MNKAKRILLLLLICSNQSLMAQEKALPDEEHYPQRISISIEMVQNFIGEFNINAEYRLNKHIAIGIAPALVAASKTFGVNPISASQDQHPGRVYNGYSIRGFTKLYLKKDWRYFEFALIYKSLHYDSVSFSDIVNKDGQDYFRNEKANVFGADILYGFELGRGRKNILFADPYFGFGIRIRDRNYTTYDSHLTPGSGGYSTPPPNGAFHTQQSYLVLVAGFKIGGSIYRNRHS